MSLETFVGSFSRIPLAADTTQRCQAGIAASMYTSNTDNYSSTGTLLNATYRESKGNAHEFYKNITYLLTVNGLGHIPTNQKRFSIKQVKTQQSNVSQTSVGKL